MNDQLELRNPNFWKPGEAKPKPNVHKKRRPKGERHNERAQKQNSGRHKHGDHGHDFKKKPKHRARISMETGDLPETPKAKKASTGLSGRTQAMRFMARKRIAAAAKAEEEERQRRIEETHWVAEAATNAASDSAPRLMCIRDDKSQFFHAAQARRSFGRFNTAVEDFADSATGAAKAEEEGVDEEDMLARYERFVGLRGNKRQRTSKKAFKRRSGGKGGAASAPST